MKSTSLIWPSASLRYESNPPKNKQLFHFVLVFSTLPSISQISLRLSDFLQFGSLTFACHYSLHSIIKKTFQHTRCEKSTFNIRNEESTDKPRLFFASQNMTKNLAILKELKSVRGNFNLTQIKCVECFKNLTSLETPSFFHMVVN